jgi:hypothetical protein
VLWPQAVVPRLLGFGSRCRRWEVKRRTWLQGRAFSRVCLNSGLQNHLWCANIGDEFVTILGMRVKDRFTAKLRRRRAFYKMLTVFCCPEASGRTSMVFSHRTHESKSVGVLFSSSYVECTLSIDRFDGREDAYRFCCCMYLSVYCSDNGEALSSPCRIKAGRRYIVEWRPSLYLSETTASKPLVKATCTAKEPKVNGCLTIIERSRLLCISWGKPRPT